MTIGLDLGKSVFQLHGVDAGGAVVVQRRLTRSKLLAFFAKQATRFQTFGTNGRRVRVATKGASVCFN